jgi:hypothetical protein
MKKITRILLFACALFVNNALKAQIYPVVANAFFTGPNSLYYDELFLSSKLTLNLVLNDQSVASRDVYLKVRIEGPNGLVIQSLPRVVGNPINTIILPKSQLITVTPNDLIDVFDINRLSFSGIPAATNSRLPEGTYKVLFTVMDVDQNVALSSPQSSTFVQLAMCQPPAFINGVCGRVIEGLNTQFSIPLNWLVDNTNSVVNIGSLKYELKVYQVTTEMSMNSGTMNNAIQNNQALLVYTSDLLQLQEILLTQNICQLEVGQKYIYTVKAIEEGDRSYFMNNGVSLPCWFHFGYQEGGVIDLVSPDFDYFMNLSTPGEFKWEKPSKNIPNQQFTYDLKLVKVDSNELLNNAILKTNAFYTTTIGPFSQDTVNYVLPNSVLNQLERMKTYAWQITAKSGNQTVGISPVWKFHGPPYVDGFWAANFLVQVTNLTTWDSIDPGHGLLSGSGKIILNANGESPVFDFSNVPLASFGNNLWQMTSGEISQPIALSSYTITPKTETENGNMNFQPNHIRLNKDLLFLGGTAQWTTPIISADTDLPIIKTEYTELSLSNYYYKLANAEPIELKETYTFPLLEPFGMNLIMNQSSTVVIHASEYEFSLDGFVELPSSVKDLTDNTVLVPFENQTQVNYMEISNPQMFAETIDFLTDADFGLRGESYTIDLSEKRSPGDKVADSSWKGVYYTQSSLLIPERGEESSQLICDQALFIPVINADADSVFVYIDNNGLNFQSSVRFPSTDTLKFNTFPSTSTLLTVDVTENYFNYGSCVGNIQIPVLDTARFFPYTVPLTNLGFQIGNIDESLVNQNFVFNALGGEEQVIDFKVTRAVFVGKNRIEMDIDASWLHFKTTLPNLQGFTAWGNGNIGFDTPNGAAALNNQSIAKSGDYNMVIDYVGCGRDRNAYAFGVSAKMNMASNISGEGGAPVVNGYSLFKNPLLSGSFTGNGNDIGNILTGYTSGADSTASNATNASAANVADNINSFADSLGIDIRDTTQNNLGQDSNHPIISANMYAQLQRIVQIGKIFVEFIDSVERPHARDFVTVGEIGLNSDVVKGMINKSPKELLTDIMTQALENIITRVNAPIISATTKATTKFKNIVDSNLVIPINSKISSGVNKVFAEIREQIMNLIPDEDTSNYNVLINGILSDTKNVLISQMTGSVQTSIDNNITIKITSFLEVAIVKQITDFLGNEIRFAGMKLITGESEDIGISRIIENAGDMFESIGDTIVDGIKSVSLKGILKTAESTVNDALTGIDWDQIVATIKASLQSRGLAALSNALLGNILENNPILSNITGNVSFDFTNLGDKIKNGELDKIVKFDPTNITIKTSACDIKGQLKHTKDDPVYGDHWRANVAINFHKPDKMKKVKIDALFITGKTNNSAPLSANHQVPVDTSDHAAVADYQAEQAALLADTSKFSYWFASVDVQGLGITMGSIPLTWMGVMGYAYHHMQKATPTSFPVPCRLNKLGIGAKFNFVDTPTEGKAVILDMQLEVVINSGDWSMELYTAAKVGNLGGAAGSAPPIAQAIGLMGYYSALKTFKGQIAVTFNTSPILCAGGTIKFKFDGLNNTWMVSAGTQAEPIFSKLLCKNLLSMEFFMEAANQGFKAGIDLQLNLGAKSPWVDFGAVSVRGTAALYAQLKAYVDVQFEPSFKLMEASIYLALGASIGIEYDPLVGDNGTFTIAGVSLAGNALYRAGPEGTLKGSLAGTVTVLGISCNLAIKVDFDLGSGNDNS